MMILLILICVFSFLVYDAYQGWAQEPLGPELAIFPTSTPYIFPLTWTPFPEDIPQIQETRTPLPTLVAETPTSLSPLFACNDLPTMIILGIGSDQGADEAALQATEGFQQASQCRHGKAEEGMTPGRPEIHLG